MKHDAYSGTARGGGVCFKPLNQSFADIRTLMYNSNIMKKRFAFTLAEVLITLAIIGVVAALTIPNLIVSYQKKETISKLQKAYSALSQMMLKSSSDNGSVNNFLPPGTTVTPEKSKEYFDTFWLKYFNNPVVSKNGVYPYNIAAPYKYLDGSALNTYIYTTYNSARIFFTTSDGISYFVIGMSYDDDNNQIFAKRPSVYVDINGIKEPNIIGKDVFLLSINTNKNNLEAFCSDNSKNTINDNCNKNSHGGGTCCLQKIIQDGWQIKEDYPW